MTKIISNNNNLEIANSVNINRKEINKNSSENEHKAISKINKKDNFDFSNQDSQKIQDDSELNEIKLAQKFLENYNIEESKENIETIRNLIKKFNLNLTNKEDRNTIAWILLNNFQNVDQTFIEIARKYFLNLFNLNKIFNAFPDEIKENLASKFSFTNIINLLEEYLNQNSQNSKSILEQLPNLFENILDNLYFQDLNSIYNQNYCNLYFNFPFIWSNQNDADLIETELLYKKNKKNNSKSIVIKILCNPPKLGKIEILITSINEDIFVNFISANLQSQKYLKQILDNLREKLRNFGWKKINLQVVLQKGKLQNYDNEANNNSCKYIEKKILQSKKRNEYMNFSSCIVDIKT